MWNSAYFLKLRTKKMALRLKNMLRKKGIIQFFFGKDDLTVKEGLGDFTLCEVLLFGIFSAWWIIFLYLYYAISFDFRQRKHKNNH